MARLDLPYLWAAKGRAGRLYWFYRRDKQRVPIASTDGQRLFSGDPGFMEAYERIHASFETNGRTTTIPGSLGHLIEGYRASSDYLSLTKGSRTEYDRDLDYLKEHHGNRAVSKITREVAIKLRDDLKDTPSQANKRLKTLSILSHFAYDRPTTYRIPNGWRIPTHKVKRLEEGDGHRPWEEHEIRQFREHWPIGTCERTAFETYLGTGQRGGDIASMNRSHRHEGEIYVAQEKTNARVWIPEMRDLAVALEPWLASHDRPAFFPSRIGGGSLSKSRLRDMLRDACRGDGGANLPTDCTLHGLRYTFATRCIEAGLDHQTIESIVGHATLEMAKKYTEKRRKARLTVATVDAALERSGYLSREASENRPRI